MINYKFFKEKHGYLYHVYSFQGLNIGQFYITLTVPLNLKAQSNIKTLILSPSNVKKS